MGNLPLTEQQLQMNNELQPKFLMGQPSDIFGNSRFKLLAHKHQGHEIGNTLSFHWLGSGFSRRGCEAGGVHSYACFDGLPSNIVCLWHVAVLERRRAIRELHPGGGAELTEPPNWNLLT